MVAATGLSVRDNPVVIASCPAHVLPLRAADLPAAKRYVLAMLPTLARRVHPALDVRDAKVTVLRRANANGDIQPARACAAIARSVLVQLVLPRERSSPSIRGNPAFYVARTRAGWVIWFRPH
jgi:hypothetical protein